LSLDHFCYISNLETKKTNKQTNKKIKPLNEVLFILEWFLLLLKSRKRLILIPPIPMEFLVSFLQTLELITLIIVGVVFRAIKKDGTLLYEGASGVRGLEHKNHPLTLDSVFFIGSCTKVSVL
jgi:hypothetical protein